MIRTEHRPALLYLGEEVTGVQLHCETLYAIRRDAHRCKPYESCSYLMGNGMLYKVRNAADEPRTEFQFDVNDQLGFYERLDAEGADQDTLIDEPWAIVHSHVSKDGQPSLRDRAGMEADPTLVWLIQGQGVSHKAGKTWLGDPLTAWVRGVEVGIRVVGAGDYRSFSSLTYPVVVPDESTTEKGAAPAKKQPLGRWEK